MKALLFVSLAIFSTTAAHAEYSRVKCTVNNFRQAEACLEKEAKAWPEGESSDDTLANQRPDLMSDMMTAFGLTKEAEIAGRADYVGAVYDYDYESHIRFYAIFKGADKKPYLLYDLNIVDLALSLDKKQPIPSIGLFFLGMDGRKIQLYSDLADKLKEVREERRR